MSRLPKISRLLLNIAFIFLVTPIPLISPTSPTVLAQEAEEENVPRAPTDTTSTTEVNGVNFSQAAQRLIPDTSLGLESCTTLNNLSSQVQAARTIWYGLNYVEGDCPKSILNPLGYLSNLVSNPQAGLGNDFLPASETVQPKDTSLTGLLFGFLNFFKNIWGL